MRKQVFIATLALGLLAAHAATAADSGPILGKWIEKLADGKGMVSEFGPNSLTTYPVDATGKPTAAPQQWTVAYRDVGGQDVVLAYTDGGGNLNVHIKSADVITVEFPGLSTHELTRVPAK